MHKNCSGRHCKEKTLYEWLLSGEDSCKAEAEEVLLILATWNSIYSRLTLAEKQQLDSFVPLIDFGVLSTSEDGDGVEQENQNIRELVTVIGGHLAAHHKRQEVLVLAECVWPANK